jgi:hypothetical protein
VTTTQLHVGDFGKDLDDEVAALVSASLVRDGLIDLRGVVANLHPAPMRARLARGTYLALGLDVPVAVGTPCDFAQTPDAYEFDAPYLASEDDVLPSGADLFADVAASAPPGGLSLVLMSGFTDAAEAFERDPLLATKVERVTMMGGVLTRAGVPDLRDGFLVPDETSNNTFDRDAAARLWRLLQELEVPTTVLTRTAARAALLPASFYADLAATGHPVGIRLHAAARRSGRELAIQAALPQGDPRRTLPWGPPEDPRDHAWFVRTFCGGRDFTGDRAATSTLQYDSLALLASVPDLLERFFDPTPVEVNGTTHLVIGIPGGSSGVLDPAALAVHLRTRALTALTASA